MTTVRSKGAREFPSHIDAMCGPSRVHVPSIYTTVALRSTRTDQLLTLSNTPSPSILCVSSSAAPSIRSLDIEADTITELLALLRLDFLSKTVYVST